MIRSLLPADSPPSNLAATIVFSFCFGWRRGTFAATALQSQMAKIYILQYLSLFFDPQRIMLRAARLEPRSRKCKLLHKKTMSREKRERSINRQQ